MKLFTKIAFVATLLDLAWHVFRLVRKDHEVRARLAFRERWYASRFGKGVTTIFYTVTGQTLSTAQTFTVAPGNITVTYGGGGGSGTAGGQP